MNVLPVAPSHPDMDARFAQSIDLLYQSLGDTACLPSAVSSLRQLFGATAAAYLQTDWAGNLMFHSFDGHDPDVVDGFVRHYARLDPTRPVLMRSAPGQWFADDLLLDPQRTPHREYVNDFARKAGIRWLRGGKVHQAPQASAFFTVHRPAGATAFDTDTLALLDRVYPHLARVSRLAMQLGKELSLLAAAEAVFHELAQPVCVVTAGAELLHANAAAVRALARTKALRLHFRQLQAGCAPDDELWRQALKKACGQSPRVASVLTLGRAGDGALHVKIVPMSDSRVWPGAAPRDVALVFLGGEAPLASCADLQRLYGLSRAEAELVHLIAGGHSVTGCAAARGVRVSTVRTQLASVLGKTGTSNQAQLLSKLFALPTTWDGG